MYANIRPCALAIFKKTKEHDLLSGLVNVLDLVIVSKHLGEINSAGLLSPE